MNDINQRLKELKIEEFVWIIYIFIIFLSFYANKIERNYFLTNDTYSKRKYQNLTIIIFSIVILVYIYFFKSSYQDYKNNKNKETANLSLLSLLGSTLILISGCLFLYIAIKDENIDIELAFN